MTFLEQSKSFDQYKQDWIAQWKYTNSQEVAERTIKIFEDFLKEKHGSFSKDQIMIDMLNASGEQKYLSRIYLFLNDFVQYMVQNKYSPRSTRLYFAFIKGFFRQYGIMIYNENVKQFVKQPKVTREKKKPMTYDMINVLIDHAGKLYTSIILFLVSSGVRISELTQIRVSDLDLTTKPVTVRLRAEITKTKVERITFISDEAYQAIKHLLAKRKADDLVFFEGRNSKLKDVVESAFYKIRERAEFVERTGTGIHQVRIHRFRDFFITQTDLVHEGLGHALAGHDKYMDEYNTYSEDQLREFYLKVEPSLTMSNDERNKKIILQQGQQLKRQDMLEIELEKLKDWKRRMEALKK